MQPKKIKCPQCGLFTFYSLENPVRPFCSERCKLIDLGEWASESYAVPVTPSPDAALDLENMAEFNRDLDEGDDNP